MTGSINPSCSLAEYADIHSEHPICAQESISLVVVNRDRRIDRTVCSYNDQSGILLSKWLSVFIVIVFSILTNPLLRIDKVNP